MDDKENENLIIEQISSIEIPVLENPDDREYEIIDNQEEEGL